MIPNVLLTSCADDVCRIWTETVKYKPSHHSTEKKQGKSIDELLRKERAESDLKQKTANQMRLDEKIHAQQHYHLVSMFHFHLAAVINPITDIALLSAIPNQSIFGRSFQLQWLNNKEVAVEAIFASIKDHKAIDTTGNTTSTDPFLMVDEIDGNLEFSDYLDTASDVKTLDQTLEEGKNAIIIYAIVFYTVRSQHDLLFGEQNRLTTNTIFLERILAKNGLNNIFRFPNVVVTNNKVKNHSKF